MRWMIASATALLLITSCASRPDRAAQYYKDCVRTGTAEIECRYQAETLQAVRRNRPRLEYPWWIGR